MNITSRYDLPVIDSGTIGQFPIGSEARETNKWFEKLQELLKMQEEFDKVEQGSYRVQKQGTGFWLLTVTMLFFIFLSVGLIAYNVYLSDKSSKSNRRIARDISDMKTYSEIKYDCQGCSSKSQESSKQIDLKKTASKIEVGRNDSVTINLNQMPSLPPIPDLPSQQCFELHYGRLPLPRSA